jgi:hypothetical protein
MPPDHELWARLERANNWLIAITLPAIFALAAWRALPSIIARITQ